MICLWRIWGCLIKQIVNNYVDHEWWTSLLLFLVNNTFFFMVEQCYHAWQELRKVKAVQRTKAIRHTLLKTFETHRAICSANIDSSSVTLFDRLVKSPELSWTLSLIFVTFALSLCKCFILLTNFFTGVPTDELEDNRKWNKNLILPCDEQL